MTLSGIGEFRALVQPGLGELGQTTSTASASSYTFGQGAGLWFSNPSEAVGLIGSAINNISLPVAQGILFVPAVAVGLLIFFLSSKR